MKHPRLSAQSPESLAAEGKKCLQGQGDIVCGWLSTLWSLFGYPENYVPYYNRDPKRDHNFDNHPCGLNDIGFNCKQ